MSDGWTSLVEHAMQLAEQWKNRADDAGRLSRAVLNERDAVIEECAKVCEEFMPVRGDTDRLTLQRHTLENVAQAIRALKGKP